jgi:hypothetical protein
MSEINLEQLNKKVKKLEDFLMMMVDNLQNLYHYSENNELNDNLRVYYDSIIEVVGQEGLLGDNILQEEPEYKKYEDYFDEYVLTPALKRVRRGGKKTRKNRKPRK